MYRKILIAFIVIYLLAAFGDYLSRDRDGTSPVISMAKGLMWPYRLLSKKESANKQQTTQHQSAIGDKSILSGDAELDFLGDVCLQGFAETSMPPDEALRFCKCVLNDIKPQVTSQQRNIIRDARFKIDRGQKIPEDYFVASGVRDLVVIGQARCEAAFYPPSDPITFKGGNIEMILRCDEETQSPEIFIYILTGKLLTKKEVNKITDRMMKDDFNPEYARVSIQIDSHAQRTESWEIDLTGQIVSPPKPHSFLADLRKASSMNINISRGTYIYYGHFLLADKIPSRWEPCGGISRR
ncbi:MAG: hypothetical protein L6290_09775 [Thermodesulfovibrionales bacterium]|nr:hypothetical protein [Thermodesulfovibrionales bacterium]